MPLPSNGTCSYNGVAFTVLYHSKVTARPIYDEANRTNIYVEHTLEVEGYIAAQTTDADLADKRKRLTKPGGILDYRDKGYGNLRVNDQGVYDAAWGPHPEILEWEDLGGANAAKIKWRVTTRIPECDDATYKYGLAAVNYAWTTNLDADGYTTIRIDGYLEIPLTALTGGVRGVNDSADNYREKIRPDIPLGFQRKTQEFKLSPDRRRLDFAFVDEEIPQPFPQFATNVDARQKVRSSLGGGGGGFRLWTFNFDVTVTLQRGQAKEYAWTVFLLLFRSRISRLRVGIGGIPLRAAKLLPMELEIDEDIYGRTTSFRLVARLLDEYKIADILAQGGLWQRIDDTDFSAWRTSLANSAGHVRGSAKATYTGAEDAIIDLCVNPKPAAPVQGGAAPKGPPGQGKGAPGDPLRGLAKGPPPAPATPGTIQPIQSINLSVAGDSGNGAVKGSFERAGDDELPGANAANVAADSSWLAYGATVQYIELANVVRHKPLPPVGVLPPLNTSTGAGAAGVSPNEAAKAVVGNVSAPGYANAPPDVFQQPTAPTRAVVLSGFGLRVKFKVPAPQLVSVGGVPAVEYSRDIRETVPFGDQAVPIYATSWTIIYLLGSPPTGPLPSLPNPAEGIGGAG